MTNNEIAATLDYAVLKPTATILDVRIACQLANERNFASVCIRPDYVTYAAEYLKGSGVKVGTVVGFPLGYTPWFIKAEETDHAFSNGATEIDMVLNLGRLKARQYIRVEDDIERVARATKAHGAILKVILETCLLTAEEIEIACKLARQAGADYVKTSTGFSTAGATPFVVQIMLDTIGDTMGVKASGGIKTREQAVGFLTQGCKRLGVSSIKGILV
jgi:deoxyribose-phosphate aldolase